MADQANEEQANPLDANQAQEGNAAPAFQLPDTAKEIVGEGKKYQDVTAALGSIQPAQEHIQRLEAEAKEREDQLKTLQEELVKRKTAEELLEQVTQQRSPQNAVPAEGGDLSQLIEQHLAQRDQHNRATTNINKVNELLAAQHGTNALTFVQQKAQEIGVGVEFLQSTAAQSPDAFLRLVGLANNPKPPQPTTGGDLNTSAMNNTPPEVKHKSVMGGASTKEMTAAWKAMRPNI